MTGGQIGRYQLRGEIGRGGMATVHRAFDPNSKREVAIKLLPPEMLYSSDFRKRFKKELETVSALEHSSIVPVYDSGEEDGQPYFVMRYMTGGSLAAKLKKGRLSLIETAEIIDKLARGLAHAHQKGIIHRDLKPENILFDAEGHPYLSDFGVAKLMEDASSDTGSRFAGTPDYASPEQVQGENDKVDHRTDVYGLGALVYRMLTGRQPYQSKTPANVLYKQITQPVPNILKARPDLPLSMELIIKTAMAKHKEDRYHSVLEFAHALAVAAFGPERTAPRELVLERKRLVASVRMKRALRVGGVILLIALVGAYFSRSYFTLAITPTSTAFVTPSATSTLTPTESPTSTQTLVPAPEIPPATPTPNGGAVRVAFLDGNDILSMNMDGSNRVVIDSRNVDKTNLQWIADGRIVYLSPVRNCAYIVDVDQRTSEQIFCFDPKEKLEGFRVSPDGTQVAISLKRTLTIVPFDLKILKSRDSLDLLRIIDGSCHYSKPAIKDVRWSQDGTRVAALVKDSSGVDKVQVLELDDSNCRGGALAPIDEFPRRPGYSGTVIPDYDWDGDRLFLLNDIRRNDSFGNLYLYDSVTGEEKLLNPIGGSCCYRDARWSPDGKYVLFLYQNQFGSEITMYYIPFEDVGNVDVLTPVPLLPGFFKPREETRPVFRPVE